MDRATADDRTTARASAEFRKSHSYRHNSIPVPDRPVGWSLGLGPHSSPVRPSKQMQTISLSASAFTILMPEKPQIPALWTASVPLLNSFCGGVNAHRPPIFRNPG
jgi:hypothetical protein